MNNTFTENDTVVLNDSPTMYIIDTIAEFYETGALRSIRLLQLTKHLVIDKRAKAIYLFSFNIIAVSPHGATLHIETKA